MNQKAYSALNMLFYHNIHYFLEFTPGPVQKSLHVLLIHFS